MTARSSPRPESLGAAGRIRASFHAGAPALALKGAVFAGRKLDDFDAPAVVVAGQDQTGRAAVSSRATGGTGVEYPRQRGVVHRHLMAVSISDRPRRRVLPAQ